MATDDTSDECVVLSPLVVSFFPTGSECKRDRAGRRVRVYISVAPELVAHILSFVSDATLAFARRASHSFRNHADYEARRRGLLGNAIRPTFEDAMRSPSLLKSYMRCSNDLDSDLPPCQWFDGQSRIITMVMPGDLRINAAVYAIYRGYTVMLEWMVGRRRARPEYVFNVAVALGAIPVVRWVTARYTQFPWRSPQYDPISKATLHIHLQMVKYLVADGFDATQSKSCRVVGLHETKREPIRAFLHRGEWITWPCAHSPCDWAKTNRLNVGTADA
jgi:hypothetical protein